MLAVRDLSVRYAKLEVLREIDVEVWQGEVVCLIGANGAGKTTLLRAISGLAPIVSGEVWFEGVDFRRLPPHQIARLGIAHVPQGRQIIPDLTVKGNLELGCYRLTRKDRQEVHQLMEQEFERFPILGERRNQVANSLSGGEQQMLAISRALMMKPRFIMMDEPSLGLAPLVVEEIVKAIWHLHETGITILLVEQAATLALAISHRGYVLQNGRVFLKGTGQELLENPDIIKGYLGG
jgi:branched-chain amino acid transport system ATP-binding protein